jgi:hypothetical protein
MSIKEIKNEKFTLKITIDDAPFYFHDGLEFDEVREEILSKIDHYGDNSDAKDIQTRIKKNSTGTKFVKTNHGFRTPMGH